MITAAAGQAMRKDFSKSVFVTRNRILEKNNKYFDKGHIMNISIRSKLRAQSQMDMTH